MASTLILEQPQVATGIGTLFTYTVPTAGVYNVDAQFTEVPPSSLAILVKKGASTVYTAPIIGQTQSALQFRQSFIFAASDVITLVLTSSAASDNAINNVKTIASIGAGL